MFLDQFVEVLWISSLANVKLLDGLVHGSGVNRLDGILLGFAHGAEIIHRGRRHAAAAARGVSSLRGLVGLVTAAAEQQRHRDQNAKVRLHGFTLGRHGVESKRKKSRTNPGPAEYGFGAAGYNKKSRAK